MYKRSEYHTITKRLNSQVVAIEVKDNAEKKTAGLDKFRQLFKPDTSFIVGYGGIKVEDFQILFDKISVNLD